LTDAYIANGQQSKAIDRLTKARNDLINSPPPAATAAAAASASAVAPDLKASGDAAASTSSSKPAGPRRTVDPVAVQLLLGKTYAGWRGHDTDALAAYDQLIKSAPEDFRGYLAKGVFLKERGRRGDAERMFLQAKFFAPESMKGFVAARAGENVVVDLPDNSS
jgi:Flp pilus assembly protein TadD